MADKPDARQGQEIRVEDGLDGGLFGLGVRARGQQRLVNLGVSHGIALQQREQRREPALDQVRRLQRAEAGAAGLDEKGIVAEPGRGVAFAKDGQPAVFAADFVGEVIGLGRCP